MRSEESKRMNIGVNETSQTAIKSIREEADQGVTLRKEEAGLTKSITIIKHMSQEEAEASSSNMIVEVKLKLPKTGEERGTAK